MRFLHLADVHLDTAFRGRSDELREELRRSSRAALAAGVDQAIRRKLDAVLIAGDLFDGDRLSVRTERFLLDTVSRLGEAGIPLIYATGNHDPGGPSGVGSRIPWPEHVSLLDGPVPKRIAILREGEVVGRVTGSGHPSAHVTEDLSLRFPPPEDGSLPDVALLHTQVMGARSEEAHDPYAPSELGRLRAAGYDYWALGHVHVRQQLSGVPSIHYPGNTQGRTPREVGPKGGLVVDLSRRGAPQVEFVELAPVRWETLSLAELEEESRLPQLATRIEREWAAARSIDPGGERTGWILRVELAGASPLHRELGRPEAAVELREALMASLGVLDVDVRPSKVRPVARVSDHEDRSDVLGEALRLTRELSTAAGRTPAELLGIEATELAGLGPSKADGLDGYLRELLEDADTALLDALLDRSGP